MDLINELLYTLFGGTTAWLCRLFGGTTAW